MSSLWNCPSNKAGDFKALILNFYRASVADVSRGKWFLKDVYKNKLIFHSIFLCNSDIE